MRANTKSFTLGDDQSGELEYLMKFRPLSSAAIWIVRGREALRFASALASSYVVWTWATASLTVAHQDA
jgi:hypothetical protein